MSRARLRTLKIAFLALVLTVPAAAAPVDSDLATNLLGGGCYPTGIQPALLDMLVLINPEWAPLMNGQVVTSTPITIHGTVGEMHGETSGDFPSTHIHSDVVMDVDLDPADADRAATGNDHPQEMAFEWEARAYPAWAWPGAGDRIVGLGRWIFDCGHPGAHPGYCSVSGGRQCALDADCQAPLCTTCAGGETCVGTHFGYSSEMHPPQGTAVIRSGRGGVVSTRAGSQPVLATRADVYLSPNGGGAGDRCVITHHASELAQLAIECFPLAQPVAQMNAADLVFDLPLPPRPKNGKLSWRKIQYVAPGNVSARVRVRRQLRDPAEPRLAVRVLMTRRTGGKLPTGFAGTILAGWRNDTTPLTHVRVTLNGLVINNALKPGQPLVPRTCSVSDTGPCDTAADCPPGESCLGEGPVPGWLMQAGINGQWHQLPGIDSIMAPGVIPQQIVDDEYLPAGGSVRVQAHGASRECVDTLYGRSLANDLTRFGLTKGVVCLNSTAHVPGEIDVSYAGPDFGAGAGSMDYETESAGGQGGHCSLTTGLLCLGNGDCPSGESCVTTGGAFSLRYRIERLP